eukprot:11473736-Alexandrium_andersonii.AAC.1
MNETSAVLVARHVRAASLSGSVLLHARFSARRQLLCASPRVEPHAAGRLCSSRATGAIELDSSA